MSEIVEEQVSVTIDNDEISDAMSQSSEINSSSDCFQFFVRLGLTKIDEPSLEHTIIKKSFFSGLGRNSELVEKTKIVAIHKNFKSSSSAEARADCFQIFSKAVADKCGGDPNIKYGWYGASREAICEIVTHGFSLRNKAARNPDRYGYSICLSLAKFPFDSVLSTEVDENGLRHLLLCRVILGKQEVVTPNSNQFCPSSPDFDSGVDDLSEPRKYIVWSVYMNSHILPCYIISFKAPYLSGSKRLLEANTIQPRSQCIKFSALISALSRYLGPSEKASLDKQYSDFRAKKITRQQLIQKVKEIGGDQLLTAVVNLYTEEGLVAGT